ncbi:unnamed protein product [Hymenolepis diminuta]|uniref:Histone RNA hairpin-binding protein RNA-binding domain-containing protein n=1 Tax=Hymenolepis diminuta TaxID=6216 RepID=A0A564YML3_HYMDI|nr:unnamed protein product [Hymenolepis diminuta]
MEQYKLRSDPKINDQLLRECDADKRKYIEKVKARDSSRSEEDFETRLDELVRRQRDIDRGRSSDIYRQYITDIAKVDRETHHPRTPNKFRKVSRRAWDGMVKKWRRTLHNYQSLDPDEPYRSELSTMGDDDDEESDDGLSAPWKAVRQQLVAEAEEDTLQAEVRENATTAATGADEDTLDANVPTVNLRGRRPFSPSNRLGPGPDVLHSGLTNDISAISMTKKSEDESVSKPTQPRRKSSTRKK